jgi:hypothetical protein
MLGHGSLCHVVSILAPAVAATGLIVSYKAYQRGGARVKVRTAYETSSTYAGTKPCLIGPPNGGINVKSSACGSTFA